MGETYPSSRQNSQRPPCVKQVSGPLGQLVNTNNYFFPDIHTALRKNRYAYDHYSMTPRNPQIAQVVVHWYKCDLSVYGTVVRCILVKQLCISSFSVTKHSVTAFCSAVCYVSHITVEITQEYNGNYTVC